MPLKSERQRKWMYANKPDMAKKWENKYKKGGKVDYKNYYGGGKVKYKGYKGGGKNTDTVPAMLTPGEVVLNEEQISSLEQYVGAKRNKIFSDIGVPGFNKGGKVEPVEYDEGYPERKETKWGKQFRDIPERLKAYKTKPKMTRLQRLYKDRYVLGTEQTAVSRKKLKKTQRQIKSREDFIEMQRRNRKENP